MKIVVLGGGISSERNVSLVTSTSVCKALRERGHKAIFVDMFFGLEDYNKPLDEAFEEPDGFCGSVCIDREAPDLDRIKETRKYNNNGHLGKNVLQICALADCVFLGLHGADGEDGKIQAALELIGVPYTGSGYLGSAMAMDKAIAKCIMNSCGVLTPEWEEITYTEDDIPSIAERIGFPCVIKAVNGGSSIGVAIPSERKYIAEELKNIIKYSNRVVVEKKIVGREFTQPVLGDKYLCAIEIIPPESGNFDYVAKYQGGKEGATEICPAVITEDEQRRMGEIALRIHKALGLSVYSRTDFIMDEDGNFWCLEVNTLPGMTGSSLFPQAAKDSGLSYGELCEAIVDLSMEKYKK